MTITHGMILAAGYGKRLRPITDSVPKPLVEVAGRPLIEYAIDNLQGMGVDHLVINISYLAERMEEYFLGRQSIRLSKEDTPLETGGGIANALPLLGDAAFWVMNSDTILVDPDYGTLQAMEQRWEQTAPDMLLLLHPRERAIGFDGPGDFFLEENGRLRRRGEQDTAPYVFTGVQLLRLGIFTDCPSGAFSMNRMYDRYLNDPALYGKIKGMVHDGDWLHVGDPQGLASANNYFEQNAA